MAVPCSGGSLCWPTGNYQVYSAAYSANNVLRRPKSLGEVPGKCRYAAHLLTQPLQEAIITISRTSGNGCFAKMLKDWAKVCVWARCLQVAAVAAIQRVGHKWLACHFFAECVDFPSTVIRHSCICQSTQVVA